MRAYLGTSFTMVSFPSSVRPALVYSATKYTESTVFIGVFSWPLLSYGDIEC